MNKGDLIDQVAAATSETKTKVGAVIDAALDAIEASLVKGERVTLPSFGTFMIRQREARTGRNPRTGEAVAIPPTQVAIFKPGTGLKSSVTPTAPVKAKTRAKAAPAKAAAKPVANEAPKEEAKSAKATPKAAGKSAPKGEPKSADKGKGSSKKSSKKG